jgi:hypothetical protein
VHRIVDVAPRLLVGALVVAFAGLTAAITAAIWSFGHMDADRASRASEFQVAQLAWDVGTRAVAAGLVVAAVATVVLVASIAGRRVSTRRGGPPAT